MNQQQEEASASGILPQALPSKAAEKSGHPPAFPLGPRRAPAAHPLSWRSPFAGCLALCRPWNVHLEYQAPTPPPSWMREQNLEPELIRQMSGGHESQQLSILVHYSASPPSMEEPGAPSTAPMGADVGAALRPSFLDQADSSPGLCKPVCVGRG